MGEKSFADRIRDVRSLYGISQRSYGLLLGISEPSIVRYERGSEPSSSNARLIALSEDPSFMRLCFDEVGTSIPKSQQRSMVERLEEIETGVENVVVFDTSSALCGFTSRDVNRIAVAMNYLASRCKSPYYTRIIKGCFVADFLQYEGASFSLLGLSYAHAPHGPVIDGHSEIRQELESEGRIRLLDDGLGLLFDPICADAVGTVFSEKEVGLLDAAASFVDSYGTVEELSQATHTLTCWKTTANGEVIPFSRGSEVTALVESRLFEPSAELTRRLSNETYEFVAIDELFSETDSDA